MPLIDLWTSDREQVLSKRIDQLIAFAGDGRLRDGNSTSVELRSLLAAVSSELLETWVQQCLELRFTDFGFVLQDLVNEIGRRIGFHVTNGVYRSHASESFDGLWQLPDGRALILESKSTTAYSISLNRVATYRDQVTSQYGLQADRISILFVVGNDSTADFEAQVRGSRFAWDIRLIGASALLRLLRLKEVLDDPGVARQIQDILFPQEFTRLDGIINLVFATAEDTHDEEADRPAELTSEAAESARREPARFHDQIIPQLERHFAKPLVKQSRVLWAAPDDQLLVSCQVSARTDSGAVNYWFGLKRSTQEALAAHPNAYCAFGLGVPSKVVVLPFAIILERLDQFFASPERDGSIRHWHIRFADSPAGAALLVAKDRERFDVSQFLL